MLDEAEEDTMCWYPSLIPANNLCGILRALSQLCFFRPWSLIKGENLKSHLEEVEEYCWLADSRVSFSNPFSGRYKPF